MSHGRGIVQSSAGPAPGDRFNIDANLQIGDADVSPTNPVDVTTEDPIDIAQQPTISAAGIYAIGDALGGLLTFANAARVAGGGGIRCREGGMGYRESVKDCCEGGRRSDYDRGFFNSPTVTWFSV